MSHQLHIVRLRIETHTPDGLYGVDIPLRSGLNVIHAENTLGKSTCLQAIIYCIGLEGAMGPSKKVPLKNALTRNLRRSGKTSTTVIETNVFLEIRNSKNQRKTLRRSSSEEKKDLITVWDGYGMTDGFEGLKSTDYFVRLEGAYTRERGFHHFLTGFLDLQLPQVLKYDGTHCPLYLEALFSIYYVEQTRGWGGIQNVLPTYLGIQNLAQKVIEYTLALDVQSLHRKKQEALAKLADLEKLWSLNVTRMEEAAKGVSGYVVDLPEKPKSAINYHHLCEIVIPENSDELTIKEVLKGIRGQLNQLRSTEIPSVKQATEDLNKELDDKLSELHELDDATNILIEDLETTEKYIGSINIRKESLKESLRKYKDIERLEKIGSDEDFRFVERKCPTCGQSIDDSLLPHVHSHQVLGVSDNIIYLQKQVKVLDSLLGGEERKKKQKEAVAAKAKETVRELRSTIRTIKDSLISENRALSREAIRKELVLEARIDKFNNVVAEVNAIRDDFETIGPEWENVKSTLSRLPGDDLTSDDKRKLSDLEKNFKSLLEGFEYRSTEISEFHISTRTYKPAIEDMELGSEASASDNIRMIWAYLYALMIVARSHDYITHHLGLLILDEPRQQEAKDVSFQRFLQATATSAEYNQQIIIGTSEKYSELKTVVAELPVNLQHFEGNLIAPLEPL
jgi:predicted nuclease with TOPRIM domain